MSYTAAILDENVSRKSDGGKKEKRAAAKRACWPDSERREAEVVRRSSMLCPVLAIEKM